MSALRRIVPATLLVVLGVAMWFSPVCTGDEWQPIDPAELKMTSEPQAPGAAAIYLYRQVDRHDTGRANTEYNYLRIKILTEEGRKYANIEIPYQGRLSKIGTIRARTIRPDGSIVNYDGKVYDKTVIKAKGVKYKVKTFTMPDVQVGSIVEYHFNYDFEDGYVFDSLWILSGELFTKRAKFTLVPYGRFAVRWSWPAGLPAGTTPPKQDPDHVIRMTTQNVPAFQAEEYMPPEKELQLRVNFVYSPDEFLELNPDKYWKEFGKKENERVEKFIGKQKAMQQALGEIVSPADAPEVKLRKIYARVQQVRNLTYERARSEQEEKRDKLKAAGNVEEVWKKGFGNGWDITWLFLGLARAAGFEAYPVLVSRRDEYFFNKARMNSHELNDHIVLVKLDGKDRYFDPGTVFTPFGLLPWSETAATGLQLNKDGGAWIETDLPESKVSKIERFAELKLSEEGSLEGKVTLKFTGLEALYRRLGERNEDEPARNKFLEEELKGCIPATIEAELKNKPDWQGSEQPLVAEFEVKVPGWVSSAGRRAFLPVGLFGASEKHLFEHAHRVYGVYFSYPYQKADDVKIELPPGWQVSSVPKGEDRNLKAVEYILQAESSKGAVHLSRVLRFDVVGVSADKYPVLRGFFQAVRTGDEQQIVLQPGAAAAKR
ncbi:MAG: DUF3857 domain-containing protein [Acidobacteriia bacterium]|nr:DUF3857 domain-containing protein [Terriglobia bacterium]